MGDHVNQVTDIIDRPIQVGDFVAFFGNVYQVRSFGKVHSNGGASVKIMLVNPSPSTRPVNKYSKEMCLIPAEEMTLWLLKRKSP